MPSKGAPLAWNNPAHTGACHPCRRLRRSSREPLFAAAAARPPRSRDAHPRPFSQSSRCVQTECASVRARQLPSRRGRTRIAIAEESTISYLKSDQLLEPRAYRRERLSSWFRSCWCSRCASGVDDARCFLCADAATSGCACPEPCVHGLCTWHETYMADPGERDT